MTNLFEEKEIKTPLADRIRPEDFNGFCKQEDFPLKIIDCLTLILN